MTASVLQETSNQLTSVATNTCTTPVPASNCAVGSILECWIQVDNNVDPTNVQDSAGNTYTKQFGVFDAGNAVYMLLYTFLNNQSVSKLQVTVTWAANHNFLGAWFREIGGCNAIQGGTAAPSARAAAMSNATDGITGNNYTPTSQPCLLSSVETITSAAALANAVAGTGFTFGANGWLLSTINQGASESIRLTSLSAKTPTFTDTTDGGGAFIVGGIVYTEGAFAGGGGALLAGQACL